MQLLVPLLVKNFLLFIDKGEIVHWALHERLGVVVMASVVQTQFVEAKIYSLFILTSTEVVNRIVKQLFLVDPRHPKTVVTYMTMFFVSVIPRPCQLVITATNLVLR